MNRREFLLSLLSVPFGWKALFRKEVKKETVTSGYLSIEHEEAEGDIVTGSTWYVTGESSPCVFQGLDRVINTGREDDDGANIFPQCKVEWEVNYGHCLQESEPYIPGQWSYHNDLCQWLSEIIERDAPGMLLEGAADIEIYNRHVYIRYPCGPHFWCPDIEEDKTLWYKRVEKLSPYSDLLCSYEWEPII